MSALLDDVAGPGVRFLLHANDLAGFAAWAEKIYDGDRHPNWWDRFRPVLPQGTSALQAGAFAAALVGDLTTCDRLSARVHAAEADSDERQRFAAELGHLVPTPGSQRGPVHY
jgi:hypothetical protein